MSLNWVTGYYPVWDQMDLDMRPGDIDYSVVTHVGHPFIKPTSSGNIDEGDITPARSAELVNAVHAAGRKALITIGGGNTKQLFKDAIDNDLEGFATALVSFVRDRGYDGIDIDWEPMKESYMPRYESLVEALQARMNTAELLTAAVSPFAYPFFQDMVEQLDQVNLMCYDVMHLEKWGRTWHNSALHHADRLVPVYGYHYYSIDRRVGEKWTSCDKGKLGILGPFYGKLWHGQYSVCEETAGGEIEDVRYSTIVREHLEGARAHQCWDDGAKVSYLQVGLPDEPEAFISYNDARSWEAMVTWAKENGYGGIGCWSMVQGWLPDAEVKQPLIAAIKSAL